MRTPSRDSNESEKRGEHEEKSLKEKVTELESSNARIELQLKELTEALVKKKNVSYFVEKDVTEVLFLKK